MAGSLNRQPPPRAGLQPRGRRAGPDQRKAPARVRRELPPELQTWPECSSDGHGFQLVSHLRQVVPANRDVVRGILLVTELLRLCALSESLSTKDPLYATLRDLRVALAELVREEQASMLCLKLAVPWKPERKLSKEAYLRCHVNGLVSGCGKLIDHARRAGCFQTVMASVQALGACFGGDPRLAYQSALIGRDAALLWRSLTSLNSMLTLVSGSREMRAQWPADIRGAIGNLVALYGHAYDGPVAPPTVVSVALELQATSLRLLRLRCLLLAFGQELGGAEEVARVLFEPYVFSGHLASVLADAAQALDAFDPETANGIDGCYREIDALDKRLEALLVDHASGLAAFEADLPALVRKTLEKLDPGLSSPVETVLTDVNLSTTGLVTTIYDAFVALERLMASVEPGAGSAPQPETEDSSEAGGTEPSAPTVSPPVLPSVPAYDAPEPSVGRRTGRTRAHRRASKARSRPRAVEKAPLAAFEFDYHDAPTAMFRKNPELGQIARKALSTWAGRNRSSILQGVRLPDGGAIHYVHAGAYRLFVTRAKMRYTVLEFVHCNALRGGHVGHKAASYAAHMKLVLAARRSGR